MTRFAWLPFALIGLPVGCTLLANNALPDDAAGGGGSGGVAGGGPTTGGGGTTSGTATGGSGSGLGGEGGEGGEGGRMCQPIAPNEIDCLDGVDDDCDTLVDCDDTACLNGFSCQPHVPGADFVLDGATSCPAGYQTLEIASCAGCACEEDTSGTCAFETSLWTNSTCTGAPELVIDVTSTTCTDIQVDADNGDTVGAMTEMLPLEPATCVTNVDPQLAATRNLCRLTSVGSCAAEGQGCIVDYSEGTACALLDGDVPCPDSHPSRELVFTGATGSMCPCDCGVAEQICDVSKHTHAQPGAACPGGYASLEEGEPCKDTTFPSVLSVNNHDDPVPVSSASCENKTPPTNGTAKTLCCP